MTTWNGTATQLLWFDGLTRAQKNRVLAALVSNQYELYWNAERLEGILVKVR